MCGCNISIHCTYLHTCEKKLIRGLFSAIGCKPLHTNESKVGIGVLETREIVALPFGGAPRYCYYSCTFALFSRSRFPLKKNQFSPACDLAGDKCWFSSGRAKSGAPVSASRYGDRGSELDLVGSGREAAFLLPGPRYL